MVERPNAPDNPHPANEEFPELDESPHGERSERDLVAAFIRKDSDRHTPKWALASGAIFWIGVIGVLTYAIFFRADRAKIKPQVFPMGWTELGGCVATTSLDGKRWLTLTDDQTAELTEVPRPESDKNIRVTFGKWSYDGDSKKYAITFNNETTNYLLLSRNDVATCILLKGDLDAANLLESWFETTDDSAPEGGPDYSERNEPH
jgi:hypothetical protein